jgi:hypothetical protein
MQERSLDFNKNFMSSCIKYQIKQKDCDFLNEVPRNVLYKLSNSKEQCNFNCKVFFYTCQVSYIYINRGNFIPMNSHLLITSKACNMISAVKYPPQLKQCECSCQVLHIHINRNVISHTKCNILVLTQIVWLPLSVMKYSWQQKQHEYSYQLFLWTEAM